MGMYDEVQLLNVSHEKFDRSHNGLSFQTKDLGNNLSEYCVFNGALYQQVDNSGEYRRHDHAVRSDYSGTLNIYTCTKEGAVERWVEYDLKFENGELIDLVPYEVRVTKDDRDLSGVRPCKPRNRVEVTISVADCDSEKQDAFVGSIDDKKLAAIREILAEPSATIFYPSKHQSASMPGAKFYPRVMTVGSFVQTREDFERAEGGAVKVTAANGDKILVVLDEAHRLL